MSLERYHQKRDFSQTPEPKGDAHSKGGHSYLIQKHAARNLHYDFRLEVDGVLKSWSVPKGPSLNPKDKRLAVETEDHPLDYADFEGVIPKPNYGGGTVMLWDSGEWHAEGNAAQALESGKLNFSIEGERLHGNWSLVKMKGKKTSGKEWLLVKKADAFANPELDVTEVYTHSVMTDRSMPEIAEGDGKEHLKKSSQQRTAAEKQPVSKAKSKRKGKSEEAEGEAIPNHMQDPQRAVAAQSASLQELERIVEDFPDALIRPFPKSLKPQLATLYKTAPAGDGWLHEIKYDGYRLMAMKQKQVRLLTRNHKDWTAKFPLIAGGLKSLPGCVLDGELVYLNEKGVSIFEGLQNVLRTGDTHRLVYYVFDVPYFDGRDLTRVPLVERKKMLQAILEGLDEKRIRYSDHIVGSGDQVLAHACEHRLEGIISKAVNGAYQSVRSKQWRKVKCGKRQEFVVVGFTQPKGSRAAFGALLLGFHEQGKLRYAGKVGTGFNHADLLEIHQQLRKIVQHKSPLDQDEEVQEREVNWVKPKLVAEIEFSEWTSANRLRHPAFVGLRSDKPAGQIVREKELTNVVEPKAGEKTQAVSEATAVKGEAKTTPSGKKARASRSVAGVTLSNPDKVLYPNAAITKQALAEYYQQVAERMLPYVVRRPLTLVRCPQGHTKHCFYQKHLQDMFTDSVKPVRIEEKSGKADYAYIEDVKGLIELVQMGTLEIHTWGCTVDKLEKPDTLVFDLDPDEGISWQTLKQAACDLRDFLAEIGLQSFLRTTGGKGLHLVVPIQRRHDWQEVKGFCKAVAQQMMKRQPGRYVAVASKAKRKNKIFIDYLRNGRGSTSVTCYSTRSRPYAPVATPLAWDELEPLASSQEYRLDTIGSRMHSLQTDPWGGYFDVRQSITKQMKRAVGMV